MCWSSIFSPPWKPDTAKVPQFRTVPLKQFVERIEPIRSTSYVYSINSDLSNYFTHLTPYRLNIRKNRPGKHSFPGLLLSYKRPGMGLRDVLF